MIGENTFQVTKARIGNGICIYTFFYDNSPLPMGFVWGTGHRAKKFRFDVMGSYVLVGVRREGIRTKINEHIMRDYDVITTQDASSDGKKFMRATGYKLDKRLDQWYKLSGGRRGTRQ